MYYGKYYYGRHEKKREITNDSEGIPQTKFLYSIRDESEWIPLDSPRIL